MLLLPSITPSDKVMNNNSRPSSSPKNSISQISNLIYNVKFECGTISGDEGPLRPGHYDTDIGILNKQDLAAKIQWSITANESRNTNSILRTLERRALPA